MPKGEHPNSRANLNGRRFKPIPEDVQRRIVDGYTSGVPLEQLRLRFKLATPRIRAVLVAHNVKIRSQGTRL